MSHMNHSEESFPQAIKKNTLITNFQNIHQDLLYSKY